MSEDEKKKDDRYKKLIKKTVNQQSELIDHKKQKKIMRKSKIKARLINGLNAISLIFIFYVVLSLITSFIYGYGENPRIDIYKNVIEYSINITRPNVNLRSGSSSTSLLKANIKGEFVKKIGGENIKIGELNKSFFLGNTGNGGIDIEGSRNGFYRPRGENDSNLDKVYEHLNILPEGTVVEAYLSFDKLYQINDILNKFEGENVDLIWLAVDTGDDEKEYSNKLVGFPYQVMWHEDDMITDSITVEKGKFFSQISSESKVSPEINAYGSGDIREANFIKTLRYLKQYESIVNRITYRFDIDETIDYVEKNGVEIYGMVITGPTKEVQKLLEKDFIKHIEINEVELMKNYNSYYY